MGRTERIFRLANLLRNKKRLRFDEMLERLDVSPATLKRDIKYLREQLGTPVAYDAFERSYQVAESQLLARHELPGLWFSEADLHSLLMAQRLLAEIDPSGGLAPRLHAVIKRVESLLEGGEGGRDLSSRIRLFMPARHEVAPEVFGMVTTALMRRRRLRFTHFTPSRPDPPLHEVSPQRLVHHRIWHLDGWCHHAQTLRRFALDTLGEVQALDEPAVDLPLPEIERVMDGGYGAFAGEATHWAVLIFSSRTSQGALREQWHAKQRIRSLEDGRTELMLPYDEPSELVMDILRYGADVEVVGNPALRKAVAFAARSVWMQYERDTGNETNRLNK